MRPRTRSGPPSASSTPGASVLSAWTAPVSGSKVRVFAAPTARAVWVAVAARASAASLCGIVTFAPAKPACPAPGPSRRTPRAGRGAAGSATSRPVPDGPARRCASPGERLCATGQPRTPRRRRLSSARVLAAEGGALGVVGGDVAVELRLRRAEVVGAVPARLDDVVEVLRRRRGGRGLDRGQAGVPDRRRRQAEVVPRVVGRLVPSARTASAAASSCASRSAWWRRCRAGCPGAAGCRSPTRRAAARAAAAPRARSSRR